MPGVAGQRRVRVQEEADREAARIKAEVLTRQRQLMRDLEVLPLEEAAASAKALSRNSMCRRGKPLGFPKQAAAAKMVVAVDVDEVRGSFLAAQNKFIAVLYSWNHTVSEYHVYEFFRGVLMFFPIYPDMELFSRKRFIILFEDLYWGGGAF